MAKTRIVYLLSLAAALGFFIAYKLWFGWFVLVVLLCLPVLSLLLSLPAMLRAKLNTDIFQQATVGSALNLNVQCGILPTPPWRCKILVRRPLTGEKWMIGPGDNLPTAHCGMLHCSVQKLKVYDYLGLFSKTIRHRETYLVPVYPLPQPSPMPIKPQLSSLSWRPKWGGGFAENHELRLYRPGDNIRQIHWKLSAKTGELIFRQPMVPVHSQLLVRLDLSGDQDTLDKKLGKLLHLGPRLLQSDIHFQIQALTANGVQCWVVTDASAFRQAFNELLSCPGTNDRLPPQLPGSGEWQYYIGGGRP